MKKYLFYLLALIAFVACTSDKIPPEIKLEKSSAYFTEDGGSTIINFSSTDAWTAEVVDSNNWCRVKPESGNAGNISLIISAEANNVTDDRTATVMLKSGTVEKTITISQDKKSVIETTEEEYSVDGKGEEIEIEISHNVDFDITIDCDWITYDKTRALETDKLTFIVAENERTYYRTGHITLSAKDGGIATKEITVKQNGGVFEIHYTSINGQIVTPNDNTYWGGAKIISNTYKNGTGIISFDKKVTDIGGFTDCITLKSIDIPDGVTSIRYTAFYNCELLENINIPNSVNQIGNRAFYGCKMLQHISIPDGVTNIEDYTFCHCSNLTSIDIPNGVTSIGVGAFFDCNSMKDIIIPDGVTKIEEYTFYCCDSLKEVTIPNSVISIGNNAFLGCALESILIPENTNTIGGNAFDSCRSLTSVYCKPNTPPVLGHQVFYNNSPERKFYVPSVAINAYKTADRWKDYADYIEEYDFSNE